MTARALFTECLISLYLAWSSFSSASEMVFSLIAVDFSREKQALCLTKRFDIRRPNACASYQDHWCPPAQSQESQCRDSARKTGRDHRTERVREIVPRFRYSLCRRAAPLCGKPVCLRPSIP